MKDGHQATEIQLAPKRPVETHDGVVDTAQQANESFQYRTRAPLALARGHGKTFVDETAAFALSPARRVNARG